MLYDARFSKKMPKQLQKLTRGRFAQLLYQSKARSAPARLSRRWALHPPQIFCAGSIAGCNE